ncbi:uncharacterized protein LOC128999000 [Macrosteles quadrilineatus]|uniref:uncharacterized protein LOC128999000 n=1 Tax=Macrosteles quadrilineatus TaxID=74068 RepID=UPI0023E12CF2|nr:uncharacterized protein LOC128999000 [Macrosteles quadrilineatus]
MVRPNGERPEEAREKEGRCKKQRHMEAIKLCGLCCLMCVGTCVLVTVTTTVVHMSRLQSLRECVYTLKTQTCTCYSVLLESASERTDEGSRYVFNTTPDCEAIHGALYSCLRALFGLSVIGILVCIFCCMLVYQLLSHERKKMYWEQLELRCRYLYGQASNPTRAPSQPTQHCACCQQFRYQQDILAWEPSENRFWNGGQVGNLYTPNPVGDEPVAQPSSSGWSWRRLPWSRQPATLPPPSNQSSGGYHQPLNCSSPDSQYGFNSDQGRVATVSSGNASYTVIEPVMTPGCHVYHWGPPPPYSDPNSPSRGVLCPPGPHHHHCQQQRAMGNYINTDPENEPESCRVLQLRIPSRRPDLPLSSSSSSVKSGAQAATDTRRADLKPPDPAVANRIKYIHNKLQSTSNNSSKKQAQEQTESEVYFADVSSCNVSVRNDSMSIYGEALDNKRVERISELSDESLDNHNGEGSQNQIRSLPHADEKNSSFQIVRPTQEIQGTDVHSPKEIKSFQRTHGVGDMSFSGIPLDCSEDDDPELVSFSRRQASLKEGLSHYRNNHSNQNKSETEHCMVETSHKNQNDFPSPMSISSPSTVGKGNGGFYAEVVNSDNGSSDSVWSGYSPDLLAPDAQYEVIPEHRLAYSEDFNGNPNECSGNRGRAKFHPVSKKRQCSQVVGESWSNSAVCSENQDFNDRQKFSGYNINSQKNIDRSKDFQRTSRSNERCLADILNSPKFNYKHSRHEQVNSSSSSQGFPEPRRNDFSMLLDHSLPGNNMGGFYYTIGENDNMCCERPTNDSYDIVGNEKGESQNPQRISECKEVVSNTPKAAERVKLNTNFANSQEPIENTECIHSDSGCKCYNATEMPSNNLRDVLPGNIHEQ